MLFSKVLQEL